MRYYCQIKRTKKKKKLNFVHSMFKVCHLQNFIRQNKCPKVSQLKSPLGCISANFYCPYIESLAHLPLNVVPNKNLQVVKNMNLLRMQSTNKIWCPYLILEADLFKSKKTACFSYCLKVCCWALGTSFPYRYN